MSPLVALAAVLVSAAATGLLTLILLSLRGTKSREMGPFDAFAYALEDVAKTLDLFKKGLQK